MGQRLGQSCGSVPKFIRGNDFADHAPIQCLVRGDRTVLEIGPRSASRSDQPRQMPRPPAVSRESDTREGRDEPGALGRQHDVGGVHVAKPTAGDRPVGGGDDRRVDSTEDPECLVERSRHAAEQVSELRRRRLEEVADVATDGERWTVAADEDCPYRVVRLDPAGHDQRLLAHSQVDRVALVWPVQADCRDAVLHRVVDGLERRVRRRALRSRRRCR